LKRVYIVNKAGEIEEELQERQSIEQAIANHNIGHFCQAFSSKAYKDKIYAQLKCDQIRDKILNGSLKVEECDNEDLYSFLTLLKRRGEVRSSEIGDEISELEWEQVVTKSKRKSALSVFLNRTYSICINAL